MTTIEMISQVLSSHASNEIDDAEALRRVHDIACPTSRIPQMLCILLNHAKAEVERHRELVRRQVAVIAVDVRELTADLEARGPDTIPTTWIAMHVNSLVEAKAHLEAARERVREFEGIFEA